MSRGQLMSHLLFRREVQMMRPSAVAQEVVEMPYGRPTVSLVIHCSQLLWRVSSLDSWFLDKSHDSAAPSRRTDKTMAE